LEQPVSATDVKHTAARSSARHSRKAGERRAIEIFAAAVGNDDDGAIRMMLAIAIDSRPAAPGVLGTAREFR
jgi:hypothetical protein